MRLHFVDGRPVGVRELAHEAREVLAVAHAGAGRPVLGAPIEEAVDDADDEPAGDRLVRAQELVVSTEGSVAFDTEVVLAAAKLDVPEAAVGAEQRLGKVRHE